MQVFFTKALLLIIKLILPIYLVCCLAFNLCAAICCIGLLIINDLYTLEAISSFIGQISNAQYDTVIVFFIKTFISELPFADMLDYLGDSFYSLEGIGNFFRVYEYFFENGNKTFWEVLFDIFPDLAQGMIATFFIYLLFGINRLAYSISGRNPFFCAIVHCITSLFYAITGFWGVAVVMKIFEDRLSQNTFSLIVTMVGLICLFLQALLKAGLIETIASILRIRRLNLIQAHSVSIWKFITHNSGLNARLAKILIKLFTGLVWGVVNTFLVWWVCLNLDGSLAKDITAQIKFYTALFIFIFVLFLENHSFTMKRN